MDGILLAVDGSEGADRAAVVAGELSRVFGVGVDVLHVVQHLHLVPPSLAAEYEHIEHVHLDTEEMLRSMGGRIVEDAASTVRSVGGSVEGATVVIGHPARTIVEHAEEHGDDTIVMGRRGLGTARGMLQGSVTTGVGHLTKRTLVTTG